MCENKFNLNNGFGTLFDLWFADSTPLFGLNAQTDLQLLDSLVTVLARAVSIERGQLRPNQQIRKTGKRSKTHKKSKEGGKQEKAEKQRSREAGKSRETGNPTKKTDICLLSPKHVASIRTKAVPCEHSAVQSCVSVTDAEDKNI